MEKKCVHTHTYWEREKEIKYEMETRIIDLIKNIRNTLTQLKCNYQNWRKNQRQAKHNEAQLRSPKDRTDFFFFLSLILAPKNPK